MAKADAGGEAAITARWRALGAAGGVLGAPVGPAVTFPGGQYQSYAKGRITWSAGSGAWETLGAIHARYVTIGGPTSKVGLPRSAPMVFGSGLWQWFTGGIMWFNAPTGAFETTGAVNARYGALHGPWGLGFPVRAEIPVTGGGTVQSFTGGNIYWTPATGAWELTGALNARYNAIPGPGTLGYPRSAPMAFGSGLWQWFTGGIMWWSAGTGAWETRGDLNAQYNGLHGPWSWYGFPTGAQYGYYGGLRQDFSGGSLLSGVPIVLDPVRYRVTAADVPWSWRPGCPVGPESLTLIRLNYYGFDEKVHRGEIIIRSDLAQRVENAFSWAMVERVPLRSMWRVDYYGGSDIASMAADNTSGFNCRNVTGGSGLSPHAYGIAVDVNTLENPYYAGGRWYPNASYVDRSVVRLGMLYAWMKTTQAFEDNGFAWGASYLDYQHFQFVG